MKELDLAMNQIRCWAAAGSLICRDRLRNILCNGQDEFSGVYSDVAHVKALLEKFSPIWHDAAREPHNRYTQEYYVYADGSSVSLQYSRARNAMHLGFLLYLGNLSEPAVLDLANVIAGHVQDNT